MSKVIESMIVAGQRLEASVGGYEFDVGEVIDEAYYDPTREPGYDLADASRDLDTIKQRLRAAKEDAKSKAESPIPEPSPDADVGKGGKPSAVPAPNGD